MNDTTALPRAQVDLRLYNNPDYIVHAALSYVSLTAFAFLVYSILRSCCPSSIAPRAAPWTEPDTVKTADDEEQTPLVGSGENVTVRRGMLRFPWRFKWILDALHATDKELVVNCGLDAYFCIRLIRFCAKLLMMYNIMGVFLLLPFYKMQEMSDECKHFCWAHGSKHSKSINIDDFDVFSARCICSNIDQMSLANLRSGSWSLRLWVPVFAMYYFASCTLVLLWKEYKQVIKIRQDYWRSRPPHLYTVLVQGIPRRMQSSSGELLKKHFDKLFHGTVYKVSCLQQPSNVINVLTQIGNERYRLVNQLELASLRREQGKGMREDMSSLQLELSSLNSRFSTLRSTYLSRLQNDIKQQSIDDIALQKKSVLEVLRLDDLQAPRFPVAFVTFRSLSSAMIAVQSQLYDSHKMTVCTAPEPRDILWDALALDVKEKVSRTLFSKTCFVLILLFWGVFTSFVGVATSTESLNRIFVWLKEFSSNHPAVLVLLNHLAPLVLVGAVSVVNPLIWLLTRFEGHVSYSEIDLLTMERYFIFLVVQVFVFYSVAGTVAKTVVEMFKQPQSLAVTLAATIPKNASFYIGFIFVELFWVLAIELVRVADFLGGMLRRVLLCCAPETARMKRTTICGTLPFQFPSPRNLSYTNAQVLLIQFIATTYAPIQPLVLPSALIFFGVANVVYTTVFTCSSAQVFDSSGKQWFSFFWCIISALVTSQLTLTGMLLGTQGAYSQALAMTVLCGLTVFTAYMLDSTYKPIAHDLPIFLASELDVRAQVTKAGMIEPHVQVVELEPSVWRYSTLTSGHDDDEHRKAPVPPKVVHVYAYQHPVMGEADYLRPEINQTTSSVYGTTETGSRGAELVKDPRKC